MKKRQIRKYILVVAVLLILAAFCAFFAAIRFTLQVQLLGEQEITLECGEFYEELGAQMVLSGKFFLKDGMIPKGGSMEISGQVDPMTLGRYTVRYHGKYLFWKAQAERTICIVDTQSPVITLNPDSEEALLPGTIYQEAGYTATDNYDGDITDRVVQVHDEGKITYVVTDLSGNPAQAIREVPHHDPIPPAITLEGGEEYIVPVGTRYREPGYFATDNVDGNLTKQVTVAGETDWLVPGTYPITYTVTDAYENTTTVIRNVIMQPAERPETVYPEEKTIYLTFDDGPGPYTAKLLGILDKYNVKATFFVKDTGEYDLMKQIVERGHSIGIHTMTHDYDAVYASADAFFAELYGMQDLIYEHTGVKTTLMRFPGGSSNEVSIRICPGIMTKLTEAVQDAGFQYFDWNVLSGDAGDTTKTRDVYNYVVNATEQLDIAVVLQHDIHGYSVAAVEDIILWGFEHGYQFLPLQENSPGYHQIVAN